MMRALALLVLSLPMEPPGFVAEFPGLYPHLEAVAQSEEIWDSFDGVWWTWDAKTQESTRTLRKGLALSAWWTRRREMADLPRLWEASRFGLSADCCNEMLRFSRRHRDWLAGQAELHTARDEVEIFSAWLAEAETRYWDWDALADAVNPNFTTLTRRWALGRLRDRIGPVRFYCGAMPPPVPVEYFHIED